MIDRVLPTISQRLIMTTECTLRRMLQKHKHWASFNKEISAFTCVTFDESNVMAAPDATFYFHKVKKLGACATRRKVLLSNLAEAAYDHFDSNRRLILFVPLSEYCGPYMLTNKSEFNWGFSAAASTGGIVSLTDIDAGSRLVIDYFEEDGDVFAEIEFWESCPKGINQRMV